eukprot:3249101-Pleurochrysis_carterae.AAC.1
MLMRAMSYFRKALWAFNQFFTIVFSSVCGFIWTCGRQLSAIFPPYDLYKWRAAAAVVTFPKTRAKWRAQKAFKH